ncbi:penicillin-binding transpeptidase domain-containing protein [Thermopolyspora sp. NPDC052614]|uniref:penicillin-binding transpeptidase domain-containing protein n=1 Tax=Thermopolyspora sp. NPDC052614 TaxID=3155682 RepID=UPI00341DF16A
MRNPRLVVLIGAVAAIVAFGVYGVVVALAPGTTSTAELEPAPTLREAGPSASAPEPDPAFTTPAPDSTATVAQVEGPEVTATRFLAAWQIGDLPAMATLVADPPADFADRHRDFDADLRVTSLSLSAGGLRHQGEGMAEMSFSGVRQVAGLGRPWAFSSVLRLALRDGGWKVLWSPETMHPSLKDGGSLRLVEKQVVRAATLTMEGKPFPADSRAGDYFTGLGTRSVELSIEEVPSGRVLVTSRVAPAPGKRTTISGRVQTAAARALDGVAEPAAIVAVDVETGQVRAVADTLGGRQAFIGLFPPGSTFKVVTAAALLRSGLTPESPVACPGKYTIPGGRTFSNADGADRGTVSFARAFALSCNTTFVQQAHDRLRDDRLRAEAADRFGFREKPGLSYCRIRPYQSLDELGSDAIGQNSVQASPLCMAEVAAAVASGVWRPAVLSAEPPADSPPAVSLDENVAASLRGMMRAVVTEGTAAQAGLPPDTAGKTGTAEVAGQRSHAWFIGYRGSIAFAVFVRNGGAGGDAAAPLAAKFLRGL